MKQLSENYYLDSDSLQYMLKEKHVYVTGKNIGEEYFDTIGYYGNLEHLYKGLCEHVIKCDLTYLENIEKIIKLIKEIKE